MFTPARSARWLIPVVLLIAWLGIGGGLGPYAGKLGEVATNDQASFLPQNAESTQVIDAQRVFRPVVSSQIAWLRVVHAPRHVGVDSAVSLRVMRLIIARWIMASDRCGWAS
ncbi:hypothetical protein YUWDRAFT_05722 [Streptomyces sp. AmelKG-D3]|nr:hypothetical protein YUWDRAFT_05722 [Streptomyces sp. AmelKG-D3]